MILSKGLEAGLRGFDLGKPATFLLNQVILNPAHTFRSRKNPLPVRNSLSKQNLVPFPCLRRPVLAMNGVNSPRIRTDPIRWIRSRFQASSYIELQHNRRIRILRQNFNRPLTFNRPEFHLVVMTSDTQTGRLKLLRNSIERP